MKQLTLEQTDLSGVGTVKWGLSMKAVGLPAPVATFLIAAMTLVGLPACATTGGSRITGASARTVVPKATENSAAQPADGAPAATAEPTTPVLLRVVQKLEGKPAHPRQGLQLWLANADRGELLRLMEANRLAEDLAAQGWIAWQLPAGQYHLVVSAYERGGFPSKPRFDRYRFSVRDAQRAQYLGTLTYECLPKAVFKALCSEPGDRADEIATARSVAGRMGVPDADRLPLRRVKPPAPRQPGTHREDFPRLDPAETMVTAAGSEASRGAYDFLGQARIQKGAAAWGMGESAMEQVAALGPLAIFTLPVTLVGGSIAEGIHQRRLKNKAECLRRIWDERAEELVRDALQEAVRQVGDGERSRHLLVLNIHRLEMASCHPASEWLPDPRGKRFCLAGAIRARVYSLTDPEPTSDEIFAFVPEDAMGRRVKPTGWAIPPGYFYETPLPDVATIKRTYRKYCKKEEEGLEMLEHDLRSLIGAMVPKVLAHYGLESAASER